MTLNAHEIADSHDNLLDLLRKLTGGGEDQGLACFQVGVDFLKDGDGEGGSLSSARLGLGNDIGALTGLIMILLFNRNVYPPLMTGMMARCWMAEGRSKP